LLVFLVASKKTHQARTPPLRKKERVSGQRRPGERKRGLRKGRKNLEGKGRGTEVLFAKRRAAFQQKERRRGPTPKGSFAPKDIARLRKEGFCPKKNGREEHRLKKGREGRRPSREPAVKRGKKEEEREIFPGKLWCSGRRRGPPFP